MQAKGPFRGHSRFMAMLPTNFRYDPTPPTKKSGFKPHTLRDLFDMRAKIERHRHAASVETIALGRQ